MKESAATAAAARTRLPGNAASARDRAAEFLEAGGTLAIVRLSALGDVLHALPAGRWLRERFPRARLLWVTQREFVPLLEPLPWLDGVLPFDRRGGWRAWKELLQRSRTEHIDVAVDLQGNWKSATAALFSRARLRCGIARREQSEPLCHLLFQRLASPSSASHAVDRALDAATSWFGGGRNATEAIDWHAVLPTNTADEAGASELERELRLPETGRLLLCLPTSRPDPRAWPAAHWIAAIHRLASEAMALPVVVTGPREKKLGEQLALQLGALPVRGEPVRHLVGQRGVRAALALFRRLAPRTPLAVGCDSGLLHLAVAAGLRTLALAGPQDALRTGPHGAQHRLLTSSATLPCRPCFARSCRLREGPRCLDEIAPDAVVRAVREIVH